MFDMTEYEKALKELDFTSLKRSIEHDGNEWERDILKNANDMQEVADTIALSTDEVEVERDIFARASKLASDGKHWYRVREILGDACKKAYSDVGGLKIGNENFNIIIPNGLGDGITRYAVLPRSERIRNMMPFYTNIKGENINIYDYDCGNDVAESISGRFGIYTYEGIVVLERWDD